MKKIYQKTIDELYREYKTSSNGLTEETARIILKQDGLNELLEKKKLTKLELYFKQFKNIMIILLLIVGVLSLIYAILTKGDFLEPIVILGTSFLNCFMGFLQESKAEDAIGKLKKYSANYVRVKRNGIIREIDAKNLVVGDYIILESGDKIPADARIVVSHMASVDESVLTGESESVSKDNKEIKENVAISERYNMIYAGTVLVSGKVEAIVVKTGMNTELGSIASVMNNSEEVLTPLQIKVKKISKFITIVAFFLVLFVLIYGMVNDYSALTIVMLCISMIVASVPECLPVAITLTLTVGVKQMAEKKSIVRNLAAIETLGATDIICTDKTGTLTKNKMEVVKIFTSNKEIMLKDLNQYPKLVEIMHLCNTATKNNKNIYLGDSVDVAIKNCLKVQKLKDYKVNKISELPFDSKRKMMSVVVDINSQELMYTKGSFEAILDNSNKVLIDGKVVKLTKKLKESYLLQEEKMSDDSLKVIAFAYKEIVKKTDDYAKEEKDFILVGLVGFKDPIRYNIKDSIETCLKANIRPIMLTGDNLSTAESIAREVGICTSSKECINASILDDVSDQELKELTNKYSVFARVSPEFKLRIVKSFQNQGKVVAMTGDGVNDAPAIKLANVGIGMGKSGTDVTKDVADILLLDDSFQTISTAIQEGRRIYDNVITNILYNLSSNFTEIIIILFGVLTGNTIISALHVLYIDLVADTIPSITLAFESASKGIMNRKPNGLNKKIFTGYFTAFLGASVLFETIISLFIYYHFLSKGIEVAQTLALLSIVINEFIFAYNCRSLKEQIYKRGILSNSYLNIGIIFLTSIQILVFFTPIGKLFGLTMINIFDFIYVVLANIVFFVIIEILKPIIGSLFKDE